MMNADTYKVYKNTFTVLASLIWVCYALFALGVVLSAFDVGGSSPIAAVVMLAGGFVVTVLLTSIFVLCNCAIDTRSAQVALLKLLSNDARYRAGNH